MTTVLVVEDNVDLAFGIRTALVAEGYDVEVAHDGRAGLLLVTEHSPDILILDLMLPELDGYSVLRELRRSGSEVPVLILTAPLSSRTIGSFVDLPVFFINSSSRKFHWLVSAS